MNDTMIAAIIMHNVIVEDQRLNPNEYIDNDGLFDGDKETGKTPTLKVSAVNEHHLSAQTIEELLGVFESIQCKQMPNNLCNNLVQHLWANRIDTTI